MLVITRDVAMVTALIQILTIKILALFQQYPFRQITTGKTLRGINYVSFSNSRSIGRVFHNNSREPP